MLCPGYYLGLQLGTLQCLRAWSPGLGGNQSLFPPPTRPSSQLPELLHRVSLCGTPRVLNDLHLGALLLLRSAQFQAEESWSPLSQRRMRRNESCVCASKNEEHLSSHKHPKGTCVAQSLRRRPRRKVLRKASGYRRLPG